MSIESDVITLVTAPFAVIELGVGAVIAGKATSQALSYRSTGDSIAPFPFACVVLQGKVRCYHKIRLSHLQH